MAYVFDPINNTLIDDEDKSFGNKLALNDDEFQKLLDIPGVFRASEAPQPPPRQEVLDREVINRFMRDNKAEGGRINQNTGTNIMTLNPLFPEKDPTDFDSFKPLDVPGMALPAGLTLGGMRLKDIFFSKDKGNDKKEIIPSDDKMPTGNEPPEGPDFTELGLELLKETVKNKEYGKEGFFKNKKVENVKKKFDKVIELYETTGPGGPERAKKLDKIRNKKFADTVKDLIDNQYGGNSQALANDLQIERVRINSLLKKHGINQDRAGNKTFQNIFLKQDKDKLSVVELTDNIKENETYLIDRTKERFVDYDKNKNKFVNYKDIAEIVGVNLPDKGEQDFFQTKLRAAKKKFNVETKKGFGKEILYPLDETLNALTKYNLSKPIAGTGRVQDKVRREFEQKDIGLFNTRKRVMSSINETSKDILGDQFIKNAGEEIGHAEAITNQLKFKKLYKNSNANDISTHVYQDPRLNKDVLQKYGQIETAVEQKRQPILAKIESFIGKKRTKEKDNELIILVSELNKLNEKPREEILQIEKENKFITDQKNRIPDFKLTLPENSKTYQSGILNIDMSNIDPSVSVGRILEINPEAKTFDDLTKGQKELYIENMKNQMIDYLQYFYEEAKVPKEDIKSLVEELSSKKISMGKIKKASGGGVEITPLPRINFNGGGAAGADVDFATQLEYFLTNENAELPQLSTYKETKNPIEVFNDIIDPRNYPYYADVLARSGVRIGEFGARVLPATGKLISDAIQKGPFKIKETGNNYVQDYTDVLPSNIKGTGIFSEFLENITPTSLEKKIGLDKLIEKEEQRLKDSGSTVGPKVFADTVGLGAEVTAPIFPGLKLLRAYAKSRNLPVDNVTKEILVKEIDEVLETQGMNRREFLQATGAGATVILAKMLGFGDEVAQTAKVVEKAAAAPAGVPPYFFQLAEIIKKKGFDVTKGNATKNLENVYSYNGYDLYEDIATGEIRIEKIGTEKDMVTNREILEYTPGRADETTKSKPADSYEEVTETNSRIYKDEFNEPNYEEGIDIEEILEFIKNEKVN